MDHRLEQIQEARDQARLAMCKAQLGWIKNSTRKQHIYQTGDQVWLDGRNLKTYHPTAKLAAKCHGPFPIQRVLSPIDYQLTIPEQWETHDMFHVDLLTPYRETEFHGPNYNRPPPDLMGGEEQDEVEQVLDEHIFGRWKKKQYLVKWKRCPNSDNQWLDAKDMENAQELIAEFHNSHSDLSSHIKRAFERVLNLYPLSTSPSTHIHMPNASTLTELPFGTRENMDPLPIPPRTTSPDVSPDQLRVQNATPATFIRILDSNFPHPNEPTPSEPNDSDQENILPPVQAISRPGPSIRMPLRRTQVAIPFMDDTATNQILLAAITRVRNNVDRGDTYVGEIEEIVRIARALRHRGTPSEDDKAVALVAQLHQIQRLEAGSESTPSETPTPTNVTFPTPTMPRNLQVTASTAASRAQVRTVASGPTSPQQHRTRGARGAGSQARHMGGGVQSVPTGVRVRAELLSPCPARRAETPPPLGFNFN